MLKNNDHVDTCGVCNKKFNRLTRVLVEKLKNSECIERNFHGVRSESWICLQCGNKYIGEKIIKCKVQEKEICYYCEEFMTHPSYRVSVYNSNCKLELSFHIKCYKETASPELMFED
jgi:hypothetical protein